VKSMPPDEVWTFLTEQARTAQCATVKENGHPHGVPVWFDVDGKTLDPRRCYSASTVTRRPVKSESNCMAGTASGSSGS